MSATFKISTALANHIMAGGSVKDALDGFNLNIYSAPGGLPASADAAIGTSDVLLCTLTVDDKGTGGTYDSTAVAGILSKLSTETWLGTIIANGTAAYYRQVDPTDPGTASTSHIRTQGSVGTVNADFLVKSTVFVTGEEQRCDTCNIGMPLSA